LGGHLELWNKHLTRCEKKILPIFNRCVIFDTGPYSFHGHPHVLNCPSDRRRNSLAVYYYILDRPMDENYTGLKKRVQWQPTTQDDQLRIKKTNKSIRFRALLKKIIPPILLDVAGICSDRLKYFSNKTIPKH